MYGMKGRVTYGEVLPNNDFVLRVLDPGLEEKLILQERTELFIQEEARHYKQALHCPTNQQTYLSFVKKYGHLELGINFSQRIASLPRIRSKQNHRN